MRGLSAALLAAALGVACSANGTAPARDPGPVQPPDGTEVSRFEFDGELVAEVHWSASPKPYVFPLCAPGEVLVTRSFPMAIVEGEEQDHPHHQSMWFAHGDVNGFDFWHGKQHAERMVPVAAPTIERVEQERLARFSCDYEWLVDENELICREHLELEFHRTPDANRIDVTVTLTPANEPLVFGDTKEGSFALRLHPELRVEGPLAAGHYVNSEGLRDGDAWGQRAGWLHAYGTIDGHEVGVAILEHPDNLRHPTWWHARTYGLMAANPFGVHDFEGLPQGTGDYELPVGEMLTLRYRVLLHAGDWSAERVASAYELWIED